MDLNYKTVKQAILDHCTETGISFDDFCQIWGGQINECPAAFDTFFEFPFSDISEDSKDARVELLIDMIEQASYSTK